MSTQSRSETRYRSESVNVRFTPDQLHEAQELADRLGCKSVPELLRLGLAIVTAEEARSGIRD